MAEADGFWLHGSIDEVRLWRVASCTLALGGDRLSPPQNSRVDGHTRQVTLAKRWIRECCCGLPKTAGDHHDAGMRLRVAPECGQRIGSHQAEGVLAGAKPTHGRRDLLDLGHALQRLVGAPLAQAKPREIQHGIGALAGSSGELVGRIDQVRLGGRKISATSAGSRRAR